ncbi:hypothetical protein NE237_029861 [Protea cynaroides]|uniref:NAB domain-containing protein n=1 Tax=Protea cynaroides TaxID=273540 RepID=A0A9Q0JUA9_9MAGN|nr:hypothetical protein NE237_029861 [Protea cynaroides]
MKDEGEEGDSLENSNRESELFDHIKDFHKQYQSLYEHYHLLTSELKEKFNSHEGHDGDSSTLSSSDFDSDHYSKEKASENGKHENGLQKQDESIKLELEAANDQVADLMERLEDAHREKEVLRTDLDKALSSIDEVKKSSEDLKAKADQLKDEKSTLSGLEAQITDLQSELNSLRAQKRELEQHFEDKSNEAKRLGEENLELQLVQIELRDQISELDRVSRERGAEISALLKKLEDRPREATTQTDFLTVLAVKSLEAQRNDLEEQLKCRNDETKQMREENLVLQQGLADLQDQVFEWERKLKEKEGEISALHEKLENRKNEAAVQINDSLLELDSLCTKENQLQLQSEEKNQGSEYEKKIENLYLEKDQLAVQVNDLQLEVNSLLSQKGEVEEQIKIKNREAEELREENQALELMEQKKRLLEDQEDRIHKLTEEYKQLEDLLRESQENLQVAQQKIDEMGEVYKKNIGSKDEMIRMLQKMAEELKKEVETGREEVTTLKTELSNLEGNHRDLQEKLQSTESDKTDATVEKERLLRAKSETTATMRRIQREQQGEIARLQDEINTIEVKIRLSNRKLHVTEQFLAEKEESYRKKEEQFEQEYKELEEQNAKLSSEIATARIDLVEIRNTVEKMNNSFSRFDPVFQKFQEDDSSFWSRIAEVSEALRIAKIWVTGRNNKQEELESTVANLVEQLKEKQEQETELKERVGQLEVKMYEKEEEEKKLMMIVRELEKRLKEKIDEVLSIGEEKREAIRQMCIWAEYNCDRIDSLKVLLSKTRVNNKTKTKVSNKKRTCFGDK